MLRHRVMFLSLIMQDEMSSLRRQISSHLQERVRWENCRADTDKMQSFINDMQVEKTSLLAALKKAGKDSKRQVEAQAVIARLQEETLDLRKETARYRQESRQSSITNKVLNRLPCIFETARDSSWAWTLYLQICERAQTHP